MSKRKLFLPSNEEMLSIFIDKAFIPENLIEPYYRLAKDIAQDKLEKNSIFFFQPKYKEMHSFRFIYTLLPDNQKRVIILYYGLIDNNPKTLEEIGKLFNLSGSRIGQIKDKALRALNKPKKFERCTFKYLNRLSYYYSELSKFYEEEYMKYSDIEIENNSDIEFLELSPRTYNAVKRHGIDTIAELRNLSEEDILKIRNIGPKMRNEIWLRLYGKHFEE